MYKFHKIAQTSTKCQRTFSKGSQKRIMGDSKKDMKSPTEKKAQAAMEFLLTYGWAIVVILSAIIALIYFGLIDYKMFLPNTCHINNGLSCLDYRIYVYDDFGTKFNRLELKIKNNLGSQVLITRIDIPALGNKYQDYTGNPEGGIVMANGAKEPLITVDDLAENLPSSMKSGERYNLDFIISLRNTESGLDHKFKGKLSGKVD